MFLAFQAIDITNNAIWQAVIAAIVTLVLAYFQMKTQQAIREEARRADEVALRAEEAAAKVRKQLTDIAVVADKTHAISNSGSVPNARLLAVATRQLALVDKTKKNQDAATDAEKDLQKQIVKQTVLDNKAFNGGPGNHE